MRNNRGTAIAVFAIFLFSTLGVVDGAINLISNPGFESGTTSWALYTSGTGTFNAAPPGYEGINSGKLAFSSSGSNIQFYQTGIALEPNTRYRLSFVAYSNTGHDVTVRLFKHVSPFTAYMPDYTVNLGTGWSTFTTEFNTTGYFTGTVTDGRLQFWLAPFVTAGDVYYVDSVILEKVGVDATPPTVSGNTPTGTNVPVTTQITVTFSEAMNQASAQSAFLTSCSPSGSFSWSGNTMTYNPSSSLPYATTCTVTEGIGAKDLAGNSLQLPYSWQFTTTTASDATPPTVTGNTPTGTNIPVTTQITVIFSEAMNQASAQSAFSTSPSTTGSFSWSGNTMTYTPTTGLSSGAIYTATIGTGAKDLAGNSLQAIYSWQFTTISAGTTLDARVAALEAGLASLSNSLTNSIANLQTQINNIQLIPGPAGPMGPIGPTGLTGPMGPAGPAGVPCVGCVNSASIAPQSVTPNHLIGGFSFPDLIVSNSFTVGNSAVVGSLNVVQNGNVGIGTSDPQSSLQITNGYIQIPVNTSAPPNSDCNSANQAGRMVVKTNTPQLLYICTGATGWITK